ncbi:unnamed protein product [Clonostachys rosea]|uniref:FAD-binding PCMH-type domain-containing protein n=1 Tax=Bionectria ochroleuca TaxID=29856 RepID=A0ABY6UFJ8_BIOOC|nr:unnamed protein product [Clonostachys rosea]
MELLIYALASLALRAYAEPVSPAEVKLYFEENLSQGSEAYLPEDSGYAEKIIPRWNSLGPPKYVVAVKPATAVDVLQVIEYASNQSIPFLGTGGGHGYTITTSGVANAVDIDLGLFTSVTVDALKNTLTIGGAVTFGEILDPLYEAGKEIRS